jgi:hypothetical protein
MRIEVWRMSSQRSPGQPFFEPLTDAGNWPASGRQSSHVPALT